MSFTGSYTEAAPKFSTCVYLRACLARALTLLDRLAKLVGRQSAVGEVEGSSLRPDQHLGS